MHLQINFAGRISLKVKRVLKILFGYGAERIHIWGVNHVLICAMRIFLTSNSSIMIVYFAIPIKCDLITEHQTFFKFVFCMFLRLDRDNSLPRAFPCETSKCFCRNLHFQTSSYGVLGVSQNDFSDTLVHLFTNWWYSRFMFPCTNNFRL